MRQAVIALLLVAGAFLGGTMVNGPGVRQFQSKVLDYFGLADGEIAAVDLPSNPGEAGKTTPGSPPQAGPTARPPAVEGDVEGADASPGRDEDTGREKDKGRGKRREKAPGPTDGSTRAGGGRPSGPAQSGVVAVGSILGALIGNQGDSAGTKSKPPATSGPGGDLPVRAPRSPAPADASATALPVQPIVAAGSSRSSQQVGNAGDPANDEIGPAPAPLDPSVTPALLASHSPTQSPTPAVSPGAVPRAPEAGPSERPGNDLPPLEMAPQPSEPPSVSVPASPATARQETAPGAVNPWDDLRRKMQALGVTRYTIEGEPSGRVVFSCLIPLAGRQAISQRFEAEGDDLIQAAQAAVRRIGLWRAAQPREPGPPPR